MANTMKRSTWRFGATALAAALSATVAAVAPAAAQQARTIDESRSVDRDVSVTVETVTRTVRVSGTGGSELRVRGDYYPEREEFVLEGDAGSMTVSLKPREDHEDRWDDERDSRPLTIELPRGASLELEGVVGGVVVRDVDGSVSVESVNGAVDYRGGGENVEAATVNGSVQVMAPEARRVSASSVNGGVTLRSAGGYASAEAVSGDVTIRGTGPFQRVQAETLSGDIEFHGRPAGDGSLQFETHSGDVDLYLPRDLSARLEAEVFSGAIESAFGGEVRKEGRFTPSKSYQHTAGTGSAVVSAEAFSGSVRFRREGG